MNAIEINNLKKIYKKRVRAVDDFSLSIPTAVIFGIVGPNGAGKSTIMNILAGVVHQTAGIFSILGNLIKKEDIEYKRKVGFVLEKPHYIEKLTIKDYLHFCGVMYEISAVETRNRTRELLQFFELEDKENELIETCSKGMKKKVSMAAALIHRPQLLILDEPLDGLDAISARKVKDNLRLMAEKGITIVLSSHNLDTMEKFCDEVAIIHEGKLLFQTKTEDIRKRIKDELKEETYQSLEEIFIDLVSNNEDEQKPTSKLSWL